MVYVGRNESYTRGFSVLSRGSTPLFASNPESGCFISLFLSWAHIFGVCWLEIVCVNSDCEALTALVCFDLDTIW